MSKPSQYLDLRQSQNLVMTPQLQQAIKLLQLNNIELSEMVEEELEKNPLLEKAENEPQESSLDETAPTEQDSMDEQFDSSLNESTGETPDFDPGSKAADVGSGGNLKFEDNENSFENTMSKPETLRDHLTEQLFVACPDNRDRRINEYLSAS